ncbi:MAG: (Fe-S)-binding protein [Desulfobacteraceae bacterium]|jgi:heterodisulfide reductase subunit D|nr:MAG: (Fe-S)-binding protein [Desulfobacteraceae bacterium]
MEDNKSVNVPTETGVPDPGKVESHAPIICAQNQLAAETRLIRIEKLDMVRILQLEACTRCGECLNWCPVYDQDQREDIIPRTKVRDFLRIIKGQHGLLARILRSSSAGEPIKNLIRKLFRVPLVTEETVKAFVNNLYECSTCGQCQVVCPANIDTVNIWENIREAIVSSGYGPLPQQVPLVKSVKAYDNPWQQPRQARTKWIRRAKKEGLLKEVPKEVKKSNPRILLFLGCTAVYDVNVRQIAINTVNIFEELGVDYGCLGDAEKCCASVMLRMGDPEFERVAKQNIEQFNSLGIETLVTSCAGCYKTIKEDYPRVKGLEFEVLHTVEFLKRLMDRGVLSFQNRVERSVTYHDPCHLGRAAGVFDAPREILKAIPGLNLLEMERIYEYSRCCGAGGGVKAGFPDIQSKMAERRIREAEATGAQGLVSACPFCFAGLQVGIKAINSPLVMSDVTSLVAKALLGTNAEEAAHNLKAE